MFVLLTPSEQSKLGVIPKKYSLKWYIGLIYVHLWYAKVSLKVPLFCYKIWANVRSKYVSVMFKYENIQVLHNQGREVGGDDYNYYVVGGVRMITVL